MKYILLYYVNFCDLFNYRETSPISQLQHSSTVQRSKCNQTEHTRSIAVSERMGCKSGVIFSIHETPQRLCGSGNMG